MASTINALTGSGGVAIDGDATGVLELQSAGTTIATVSSTGLAMASGKTIAGNISYPARAWVNFNGTLAAASMIQASGNVSSITDSGTGRYTINFAIAMPHVNYVMSGTSGNLDTVATGARALNRDGVWTTTTAAIRNLSASTNTARDDTYIGVIFLR